MDRLWRVARFLVLFGVCAKSFNLDPESFLVISISDTKGYIPTNESSSLFGSSSSLYVENNQPWLLVGAPNASKSVSAPEAKNPGAVYKCPLTAGALRKDLCSELQMDYQGNVRRQSDQWDRGNYTPYKSNQWFGVSMDASIKSNTKEWNFVACGHLRKNTIQGSNWNCDKSGSKSKSECYRVTGACFARKNLHDNTSDQVHRPAKLNDLVHQKHPYLLHPESGISVHLTSADYVIMGAPGSLESQGGVIIRRRNQEDTCVISRFINAPNDSYIGYSVTSLRLRPSKQIVIAGGSPRYNETGKVYIFIEDDTKKQCGHKYKDWRVFQQLESQEPESYGSYFGASILAADVDGDDFDELFVGAPFQSLTHGDEGAVYCYTAEKDRYVPLKRLTGSNQPRGRFGTSIALAGDVNLDGFNDVIVGAPYEDDGSGAVYLFIGSRSGITTPYSQRIAASNFAPLLKTFGQSISTGRDFDGNGYPDIAVGAFGSESVIIIRPRPVHDVRARIWFPVSVIEGHQQTTRSFEVNLVVSFFYTIPSQERKNINDVAGKHIPFIKGLSYDLHIDETRRGFLLDRENNSVQMVTETIDFASENLHRPLNRSWTVAFKKYPADICTPLTFRLKIRSPSIDENITQSTSDDRLEFVKQSAMLNDMAIKDFSGEIGFFKLWNSDDICTPEVLFTNEYYKESNDRCSQRLSVNVTPANDGPWIVGGSTDLILSVTLTNLGQTAQGVRLKIAHSSILNLKGLSLKHQGSKVTASTFDCLHGSVIGVNFDVGDRIPLNGSLAFNVSFDGKSVQTGDDYPLGALKFITVVTVAGRIADKPKEFQSLIQYDASLESKGSSDGQKEFADHRSVGYALDGQRECCTPENVTLEHVHDIRNKGPGLMPSVIIDILLPNDCVSEILAISVTHSSSSKTRLIAGTNDTMDTPPAGRGNLDCVKALSCECQPCSPRRFKIGTMFPEDSVDIKIGINISTACLSENQDQINFTSVIKITTATKHQWSKASSVLKRITVYSIIPNWLYVVCVVVGILLLVLVIYGLWKCGFFKRKDYTKKKDQILRQSQMARRTVRASETDADGTVDDDPKKSLCVEEESPKSLTAGAEETKKCLSVAVYENTQNILIVAEDEP